MRDTDRKAVRYVAADRVTVHTATFNDEGQLVTATGHVEGSEGRYTVMIDPDGVHCTCKFGQHQDRSHSHDQALRLQAQRERENG